MPTYKINLEVQAPAEAEDRTLLHEVIQKHATSIVNIWPLLRDTTDGKPIKTTLSCSSTLENEENESEIVSAKVNSFSRKYSDGRKVRTSPPK